MRQDVLIDRVIEALVLYYGAENVKYTPYKAKPLVKY